MTSFPALRRDIAGETSEDEERSALESLVLPELPRPSRAAARILTFFAREEAIHRIEPETRYLH